VGQSGDTISIPSGATLNSAGTNTLEGIANTPSFFAKLSANQSIPNASWSLITLNATDWDTDSAFNTSTNRFVVPSNKAGKYVFSFSVGTSPDWEIGERLIAKLYINGSSQDKSVIDNRAAANSQDMFVNNTITFNLSVGDYVQLYCYHNEGASQNILANHVFLTGNKLIGA
jgi:hypothetical protein